jgi:hypothetical protein
MHKNNELFWAFVIAITLASVIALVGFLFVRPENTTQAMFRLADSLVTGALGFFAGRASLASSGKPDSSGVLTK